MLFLDKMVMLEKNCVIHYTQVVRKLYALIMISLCIKEHKFKKKIYFNIVTKSKFIFLLTKILTNIVFQNILIIILNI